jgi:hypothetical protein
MTVAIVNMRGCWEIAMFQKQKERHYKSWLQDDICIDLNHWADERKCIKLWSKLSCAEILATWYDPQCSMIQHQLRYGWSQKTWSMHGTLPHSRTTSPQLNLITPFTGWLQPIHVHIRLQQRSADFTWLSKNKVKLLSRNRISCDITKRQKYEIKLYNLSELPW